MGPRGVKIYVVISGRLMIQGVLLARMSPGESQCPGALRFQQILPNLLVGTGVSIARGSLLFASSNDGV